MNVAKLAVDGTGEMLTWWCPGCDSMHSVPVSGPSAWGFNGSLTAPTLTPSVLVHSHGTFVNSNLEGDALMAASNKTTTPQCHTFIREGRIQFLSDCTHELAGQTVPMRPEPA